MVLYCLQVMPKIWTAYLDCVVKSKQFFCYPQFFNENLFKLVDSLIRNKIFFNNFK